ncbi:protoporphyrinogen oxidase [Bhargavaea beijingensis]|uniref:Coproporphyrinogen III oxidase n=1 Tax=Bhargavaea beijingensis TaxID=426756 RepID=A0ABX9ZF07_9BACL|nr:protoporphyrinogen oxidase [Bhargavaea beijingensis]RSK35634.1 protoporphyrinogen oxidase [Bhargavaea beijingensis]
MKHLIVIGGGITGLSAAHRLHQLAGESQEDIRITLVEAEKRLGGKLCTLHEDGFIMEAGADSIVARHEAVGMLVEELGLRDRVVHNATGISYLYRDGELHAIPADTVFGIPMDEESLMASTLVSEEGKRAALKDFEETEHGFTKDSPIGSFLRAFLGDELVERQVAPVLSGVYSGSLDSLTLGSTLPYLLDYKNEYGSIIRGLGENRETFQSRSNKKFLSFDGGLSVLIDRMEEEMAGVRILKGAKAESLEKREGGYAVTVKGHGELQADGAILALPDSQVRGLLGREAPREVFDAFTNASILTMYLGYDLPDSELPTDGTGFINAGNGRVVCDACTWTSRKWPHTSPDGRLLVRLFYKNSNPKFQEIASMDKEELVALARLDLKESLGLDAEPSVVEFTPWLGLMPKYSLGHRAAVEQLEQFLDETYPDIHVAGASFHGVGIGLCIADGREKAERLFKAR